MLYLVDDWPYEFWPSRKIGTNGLPNNYSALLPHISSAFHETGLEMRLFYTHQMSAPSRRSLLSGRYMTSMGKPFGLTNSLSTRVSTIGDRLKAAGYATS